MSILQPLIAGPIYARILALYQKFAPRWIWDLPHAQERLQLYEDSLPELSQIRMQLAQQIEVKLGRTDDPTASAG